MVTIFVGTQITVGTAFCAPVLGRGVRRPGTIGVGMIGVCFVSSTEVSPSPCGCTCLYHSSRQNRDRDMGILRTVGAPCRPAAPSAPVLRSVDRFLIHLATSFPPSTQKGRRIPTLRNTAPFFIPYLFPSPARGYCLHAPLHPERSARPTQKFSAMLYKTRPSGSARFLL